MGVDNRDWHRQWWRDKLEKEERQESGKESRLPVVQARKRRRDVPFLVKLATLFAWFVVGLALLRLYLRG